MKTILFVQGLGMTKHEYKNSFDEIATRLKITGFQTIQFDLPNQVKELGLRERARHVQDVAIKNNPVGILAQSYGAITAMMAHLPTVKSQIFIGASISPVHAIKQVYEEVGMKINYHGDTTMPRSSGEHTTVGNEFWEDIENFNDREVARKITIPTLILHGSNDSKIPVATVQSFFKEIPVQDKKLKIYQGGDHGIVDVPRSMREEFLQDIVAWFNTTLS